MHETHSSYDERMPVQEKGDNPCIRLEDQLEEVNKWI